MSSSDEESRFGTIFMGPTPDRETTLERLYDAAQREVWNQQTEEEYLERVKARATERVRALLLQARRRGDDILREAESKAGSLRAEAAAIKAEAEQTRDALTGEARALLDEAAALRDAARSEGYEEGRARAEAELAETRRALGETTAVVLLGIHEQCAHIFEAWRADLVALLREAVEKGTGLAVDRDRAAVLEQLLDRSMRALLDRRRLIVRVNPVDAALVTDMLADAKRGGPRADNWELTVDPELEPGSLVVESESGLVNNSRGVRRSVVDEVLEHLTLPAGQADQDAVTAVARTLVEEMRGHGVELEEEGDEASSDTSGTAPVSGEAALGASSDADAPVPTQTADAGSPLAPEASGEAAEPVVQTAPSLAEPEPSPPPAEAESGSRSRAVRRLRPGAARRARLRGVLGRCRCSVRSRGPKHGAGIFGPGRGWSALRFRRQVRSGRRTGPAPRRGRRTVGRHGLRSGPQGRGCGVRTGVNAGSRYGIQSAHLPGVAPKGRTRPVLRQGQQGGGAGGRGRRNQRLAGRGVPYPAR